MVHDFLQLSGSTPSGVAPEVDLFDMFLERASSGSVKEAGFPPSS
jgi:hypothetical protein